MVTEFTIDRAKWLSGDTEAKFGAGVFSRMKDTKGRMCCLGFYCNALGTKGMARSNDHLPIQIRRRGALPAAADWLVLPNGSSSSTAAIMLAITNDDLGLSAKEREAKIKRLFRKQGVKVNFVGRAPRVTA